MSQWYLHDPANNQQQHKYDCHDDNQHFLTFWFFFGHP